MKPVKDDQVSEAKFVDMVSMSAEAGKSSGMEKLGSLNLAFLYHVPFWEEGGEIWTSFPPIGRYVEALAKYFCTVTLITPVRNQKQQPLYHMRAKNLRLVQVASLGNVQSYYLHLVHFYKAYFKTIQKVDCATIRMPTLPGLPVYLASKIYHKPLFLVIVGENYEFIKHAGYSGIKQSIASSFGRFHDGILRQMVREFPSFTNGDDLYQKYQKFNKEVYRMRSSTIIEEDILPEFRDTCQSAPYKILTVGIISPRKGTSLIPETLARLEKMGVDVTWKYIGRVDGNAGEMELAKTRQLAKEYGVAERLAFESAVGFEELMSWYRTADIFVLPTFMEGVPRVILEAQASGLPVISTYVGGIPGAVKDGEDAILVPPGDPQSIANAILRIIKDEELRKRMIAAGLESARNHTLDAETKTMIERLNHSGFFD